MNRLNLFVIGLLFAAAIFTSCNKDNDGNRKNVYVAGYEANSQGVDIATLWKNGVAQKLNVETGTKYYGYANSVYVSGNDVYVAGRVDYVATLWKNGIAQNLEHTEGSVFAGANSVYVVENDVYVAGWEDYNSINSMYTKTAPRLWKNGVIQNLNYGTNNSIAYASSVYVSDNNVYVVGWECTYYEDVGDVYVAKLWKNGVAQNLTDKDETRFATASSVYVYGDDVYVAGEKRNEEGTSVAVLWKNGKAENLTDGTIFGFAFSIYASNNDVYVAGRVGWTATLWKNGIAENLISGTNGAHAHSVFVSENDVYVGGYEWTTQPGISVATLWKNGERQNLTDGKRKAEVMSVFIK